MPIDPELEEMLQQEIDIKRKTGVSYGQPVHGIATTHKVYWEEEFRSIKNIQGQEVVSRAMGILRPDVEVSIEDKVIDPGGKEWIVLSVQTAPDLDGGRFPHHKEIYV